MTIKTNWQIQQETIEYYKQNDPTKITRTVRRPEKEIFEEIGIWNVPQNKPQGYLRLHPEDFVVEEEMQDGAIVRVNDIEVQEGAIEKKDAKEQTLYAHLTKVGIPTNVAIKRVADYLKIDIKKIGFAGLKDADAVTAQLIAFPRVANALEMLRTAKIDNIILSNFRYGQGSLNPGSLNANIFTITLRTGQDFNPETFNHRIEEIKKSGVLNYFQSQRFGGLRLLSHRLGMMLCRGEYEQAIKVLLFVSNADDIPLIIDLRKEAEQVFPDFTKIKELYGRLPYTFANELVVIEYLEKHPDNYIGAINKIPDQARLWAYAYSSWLFNKYLSVYSQARGCTNEKFPIFLSDNPDDAKIYKTYLEEDGTEQFQKYLAPFGFIQLKSRALEGRIFPKVFNYKVFNDGVVISFSLPKGSYATTFLTNLFELVQGLPIPEWVNTVQVDPKAILGEGNIENVKIRLKDYWYSKVEEIV